MYYSNYKLWSVLLVVVFLVGCPAVQVTDPGQPDSPEVDTATYHIVRASETLYGIAGLYGRDYLQVATWNGLVPPYALAKGQKLRIDGPNDNIVLPPGYDNAGVPVNSYPVPSTPISTPQATHVVKAGETLYSISRIYGQKVSNLTRWNNINPKSYQLSIGQVLIVSKVGSTPAIPSTPSAKFPKPIVSNPRIPPVPNASVNQGQHIVLKGDTLYSVARHYGFSVPDIAAWNGIRPPYSPLRLGQKLRVTPPNATISTPSVINTVPSVGGKTHKVATGETMYSIARKYGLEVKDLADWNNLVPPYILTIGTVLRVAPASGPSSMRPNTGSLQKVGLSITKEHEVQTGETLEAIAQRYNVPFANLAAWNRLGPPYNVYPGLRLKIVP
jgi:LysM repeat protein